VLGKTEKIPGYGLSRYLTIMIVCTSLAGNLLLAGCDGTTAPVSSTPPASSKAAPPSSAAVIPSPSAPSPSAVAKATDSYVVQLGYYNCDHMTAAPIAYEAGFYKALGINVSITGNGQVPTAMAAGKMDVGYCGLGTALTAHKNKVPIFIAAANHSGGSNYLVVANDIKEPADLLGKPIALSVEADKRSYRWIDWTSQVGIPKDPSKYQTLVDMTDANEYLALKTGKIELFDTCDPWGSMAEYEKTGRIVYTTAHDGFCCGLFMREGFAQEHPELATLITLAHTRAIEYIYEHPFKSAQIFATSYTVPLEVAYMTIWKKTNMEGRTLIWEVSKPGIQSYIDQYNKAGIPDFQNPEPVDNYVNTTFLDKSGADNFNTFIKTKIDPVFPVGMSFADWKTKAIQIDGK
jgi:NitT/TauT family transport system substrate-binding protein